MLIEHNILFLVFMHVFRVMTRAEDTVCTIFIRRTVCVEVGMWSAPLLLGVYCVSITNNVGALTRVIGRGFVATAHKTHNIVRHTKYTRALRHEENT